MHIANIVSAVLFALTLCACTSTASTVTTRYYSVSGTTSDELDRQLRQKGPMHGHALAVAAIRFVPVVVRQGQTEAGCVFKTARFKVDADITLPRWRERSRSDDPDLKRAWDALSRYARAHERTHVRIAESYADKLGEAIEALPARETCEALDADAERVVRRIDRAHNAEQLAFDDAEELRLDELLRQAEAQAR
ncbi:MULTISPECIES: DUF922 domain-containing protein [unclassified Roseitalea]|uniref:DUF922 domain-containing protein n=1 Tax=unclassified Roseitalea TaxID=2639107 RepID=UPI00274000E1|nr:MULTISPECIES: DUF922 domain-containing protein [unclassified Roseitalea]